MDIGPDKAYRAAFREVFEVDCTPANYITAIRSADPRLDEVAARYAPTIWLKRAARRDRIAELVGQNWHLMGRDGPGQEMRCVVWEHFPDAGKVEIHNICCDVAQARAAQAD